MPFETTLDLLTLRRDGVDDSQWPRLSCSQAQQAALAVGDLRLDAGREVLFQDQGQIRSFDDAHKLVFNRAGNLLELHEQGDIRFLTGGPPPTERLRIRANGQVGLGTAMPTQALEVVGTVKATAFQGDGAGLTGVSATDVTKVAKTGDTMTGPLAITAAGTGLRVTQDAVVGGTLTVTGNVGIGTTTPQGKLDVSGNLVLNGNATTQLSATGDATVLKGSPIVLDLSPLGGGQLQIGNNINDNKIFLEGFSRDGNGHASEMLITGRFAQSLPLFSVLADTTRLLGTVEIGPSLNGTFTFSPADASPNAGYIRFGDQTGWKLHFGRSRERSVGPLNTGTTGVLMTIQDNGNVGIGTTRPATKLEVVGNWTGEEGALRLTGDKPTVRFSGGALSGNQVWILHLGSNGPGNLEFFRRTGPSSWSNVMSLAPTGNVGIGTPAPATKLHVRGARIRLEKAGTNQVLDLRADGSALDIESAGADLHLNSNNLPVRIRNLIQGSSRDWKEDIADLPLEAAMQVLQHLNPISFAFKEDASHQHHLGFVAEEVPVIVATPDQKGFSPMAIIAVLTKVVKQQQEQISAFHEDMVWLKDRVK